MESGGNSGSILWEDQLGFLMLDVGRERREKSSVSGFLLLAATRAES